MSSLNRSGMWNVPKNLHVATDFWPGEDEQLWAELHTRRKSNDTRGKNWNRTRTGHCFKLTTCRKHSSLKSKTFPALHQGIQSLYSIVSIATPVTLHEYRYESPKSVHSAMSTVIMRYKDGCHRECSPVCVEGHLGFMEHHRGAGAKWDARAEWRKWENPVILTLLCAFQHEAAASVSQSTLVSWSPTSTQRHLCFPNKVPSSSCSQETCSGFRTQQAREHAEAETSANRSRFAGKIHSFQTDTSHSGVSR